MACMFTRNPLGKVKLSRSSSDGNRRTRAGQITPLERRKFFEAAIGNNIENIYNITWRSTTKMKGISSALLRLYHNSPTLAVMTEFPELALQPWRFRQAPLGWWSKLSAQVSEQDPVATCCAHLFVEHLASKLNVKSIEDWPALLSKSGQLKHEYRTGVDVQLFYHFGSLRALLKHLYPFLQWTTPLNIHEDNIDKIVLHGAIESQTKSDFWIDKNNRLKFIETLMHQLGGTLDSMYKLSRALIISAGGKGFLSYYGDSITAALEDLYPQHNWHAWKFPMVPIPKSFWMVAKNRRRFFESLLEDKPITYLYEVCDDVVRNAGGASLLKYINSSLLAILIDFPEHFWSVWKFKRMSNGWVDMLQTALNGNDPVAETVARIYLEELVEHLKITKLTDWYRVSTSDIDYRYRLLIKQIGGLQNILARFFPHHKWNYSLLHKRSTQRRLLTGMVDLFPDEDIIEELLVKDLPDFRVIPPEVPPQYAFRMRIDVAIPRLRLLLEYHGRQHFTPTQHRPSIFSNEFEIIKLRDKWKKELCEHNNYTLVIIDYNWDGSVQQLKEAIAAQRPDLVPIMNRSQSANLEPKQNWSCINRLDLRCSWCGFIW